VIRRKHIATIPLIEEQKPGFSKKPGFFEPVHIISGRLLIAQFVVLS